MNKETLYNRKDRKLLKEELLAEPFNRTTCSFYKYVTIKDPSLLRDSLYRKWVQLNIFGRVYVSLEGINAQVVVQSKIGTHSNKASTPLAPLKIFQ